MPSEQDRDFIELSIYFVLSTSLALPLATETTKGIAIAAFYRRTLSPPAIAPLGDSNSVGQMLYSTDILVHFCLRKFEGCMAF